MILLQKQFHMVDVMWDKLIVIRGRLQNNCSWPCQFQRKLGCSWVACTSHLSWTQSIQMTGTLARQWLPNKLNSVMFSTTRWIWISAGRMSTYHSIIDRCESTTGPHETMTMAAASTIVKTWTTTAHHGTTSWKTMWCLLWHPFLVHVHVLLDTVYQTARALAFEDHR